MDYLDHKILKALQENARISFTEISKNVGLSSPSVAERIRKMEDDEIITGYSVDISHQKLNRQLHAIIHLRAFTGKLKAFLIRVNKIEEVQNCYRVTGNENIIMEVILRDQHHLEELIDTLIEYGETRTHIVLSQLVKNNLSLN